MNMNPNTMPQREVIYLAALLHDIGKFWQRADTWYEQSPDLTLDTKKLDGQICPPNRKGGFGYLHVLWTHQLFQSFHTVFDKVLDQDGQQLFRIDNRENTYDNLVNLSIYHHQPYTELQALIQLADHWSSGIDRREDNMESNEEWKLDHINYGKPQFKKVPLFSIFSNILVNKQKHSQRYNYAMERLDLESEQCFFPNEFGQEDVRDLTDDYQKLWQQFTNEFANLPGRVRPFLESLLLLLKKYTWCIPSSTQDMANVSLFDHLKSTAAIADCLYAYWLEHRDHFHYDAQRKKLSVKQGNYPLLMLCCDLSGIQKFIYNISSSRANVSLKGRSFYIQLVQETIQRELIHATGTQTGHVIYASGGKFYMLLPNTEDVREALRLTRDKIERQLWEEQKQKLYACIDWIPFCYYPATNKKENARIESPETMPDTSRAITTLGDLWKAATDKAAALKGRKYQHFMTDIYDLLFGKAGKGVAVNLDQDEGVCSVTGEEPEPDKKLISLDDNKYKDVKVLEQVRKQVDTGRALKDATYLLFLDKQDQDFEAYYSSRIKAQIQPLGLGHHIYLLDDQDIRQHKRITSADFATVYKINNTDFLGKEQLRGIATGMGFLFYGGNCPASKSNGEEKTFHDLAISNNGEDTFLAVLRMDVDGLGQVFQHGFANEDKSFAAYATLSGALDYFFSGYINTIRKRDEFKDWVNIVYSGGDDLFAVGRWAEIVAFAEVVRREFQRFVCGRTDFSLSGGIALMGKKYPISLGAEEAGQYESRAKAYRKHSNKSQEQEADKNAICLFGEAISWETEFDYVKKLMCDFYKLVETDKQLSKGFLQKLIELKNHKDFLKSSHNRDGNDYSYRWNAAYYLKRVLDRYKTNKPEHQEVIDLIKRLQRELFADHAMGEDRYLDLAALAARWAEFHIKENIAPIFSQ